MELLEILLLCFCTTSTSYMIGGIEKMLVTKDLANNGYFLKNKEEQDFPLYLYIPIYNVIVTSIALLYKLYNKSSILSVFDVKNELEKMTYSEIQEYKKESTIRKVYQLKQKREKKLEQEKINDYKKKLREYYELVYDEHINHIIQEDYQKEYQEIMKEIEIVNNKVDNPINFKEIVLDTLMENIEKKDPYIKKMNKQKR